MNFIAQRPEDWNSIVGQERAVRLLQCILKTERFMPRGYLFQGIVGVGKTTTAYILAKSLMCTGSDPLGCGKCASCTFIDKAGDIERGLNLSADFKEVDAASNSGVDNARGLMDIMNSPPSAMSKRRVIIIDEAHQLTREAWDVYLKPTEAKDTSSIFIFVSNQVESIPASIISRLTPIHFERVHVDLIFGLLVNLANRNDLQYEHEALRHIAVKSKGIIRDAVKWLGMIASMGTITVNLVKDALHDNLEDLCIRCYESIIDNNQVEAVKWIDEAGRNYSTSKVIETMFSIYARTPWADPGTIHFYISNRLPNVAEIGAIFIKWLSNTNLPADALPLVIYEILNSSTPSTSTSSRSKNSGGASMVGVIPAIDIEKFLNG